MAGPKIKSEPNDQDGLVPLPSIKKPRQDKRTWRRWLLSLTARLLLWYAVLQVLITCPNSLDKLADGHSAVCRPYLEAKTLVVPYLQPYYQTYAAPYVERARPYTDVAYNKAYEPAYSFAKSNYNKYGAPLVARGRVAAGSEWEKTIKPKLDLFGSRLKSQYDVNLKPVVDETYAAAEPYYKTSRSFAEHHYSKTWVPVYEKGVPYAQKAYEHGHELATEVVYPRAKWVGEHALRIITSKLWPALSILYGENVQPQLIKIRERLANYREGKRLEALAEQAVDLQPQEPIDTPYIESSAASSRDSTTAIATSSSELPPTPSSVEKIAVQQEVTEELKIWQAKFIRAAAKGTEDLQERVNKIASVQLLEQVERTGEALLIRLEETARTAVEGLKKRINLAVLDLPADSGDEEFLRAVDQVKRDVRIAGQEVKSAAQDVRAWKTKVLMDTSLLLDEASASTLEVLDGLRDLGLQEIGIRWAKMEDVTYEHWTEYHKLKKTFDKWRHQVQSVTESNEAYDKVKSGGEDVESRGMAVAEDAVQELVRLRDVASWKIHAGDSTDDFSDRAMPAAAVRTVRSVVDMIESVIGGSTSEQATIEAVTSRVSEAVGSALSAASSFVDPAVQSAASVQSDVSEAVLEPLESILETITSTHTVIEHVGTVTSRMADLPSSSSVQDTSSSHSSEEAEKEEEKTFEHAVTELSASSPPPQVSQQIDASPGEGAAPVIDRQPSIPTKIVDTASDGIIEEPHSASSAASVGLVSEVKSLEANA